MIDRTNAYDRFKQQGIELVDFCVLQSFAIPCLEEQITGLTGPVSASLPPSTYIKNTGITATELRRRIGLAGAFIGKELLLSTFSYFEAYVIDAFNEILEFHGDASSLSDRSKRHIAYRDQHISTVASESRRKVREYPKPGKSEKYMKHARTLHSEGYPLPSQRLSAYGWNALFKDVKRSKAHMIPDLLETALAFPLSEVDRSTFHNLRDKRNDIAHGRVTKYPVKTALKNSTFFRELAIKIDLHIVEHFLVVEYPLDEL